MKTNEKMQNMRSMKKMKKKMKKYKKEKQEKKWKKHTKTKYEEKNEGKNYKCIPNLQMYSFFGRVFLFVGLSFVADSANL